jgi:hypothetical protein
VRLHDARNALVIAALLFGSAPAGSARAEPSPSAGPAALARARALFKEARRLEDAGKWAEALVHFRQIAAVKITPQVRFHLALCNENLGQWTEARDGYARAAREAATIAPDVEAEAGQHLRYLNESLPSVTLVSSGAAPDDELSLDHRHISLDTDSQPLRLDPGPHVAELRRGGELLARASFILEPRATRQIELRVEGPAPAEPSREPPLPPRAVTPPPAPPSSAPTPLPMAQPGSGVPVRALGWAALGLGTASAMAAGVFVGMRTGALDELDMACPTRTHCDRSVESIVRRGTLDASLINVFSVLAVASVAGGVALLVTAPPASTAPPAPKSATVVQVSIAPTLGRDAAGLLVGGRF